jgi:hypothetical protein
VNQRSSRGVSAEIGSAMERVEGLGFGWEGGGGVTLCGVGGGGFELEVYGLKFGNSLRRFHNKQQVYKKIR